MLSRQWAESGQGPSCQQPRSPEDTAAKRPFVVGAHVWTFADFATAQADHRPHATNFKGVFTRDRRPKLAAHALRRRWRA